MGVIYFRAFRTRGVYVNYESFRRELADSMINKVLPRGRTMAQDWVSGWATPPVFPMTIQISERGVIGTVTPVGPGSENWRRVSRGVEGHYIRVRKSTTFNAFGRYKPALRLNRYRPSTTPGGSFGVAPFRIPPTGYRRVVWWPGIRPRLMEEKIAKQLQPFYRAEMEKAARRGVRAAQREGSSASRN